MLHLNVDRTEFDSPTTQITIGICCFCVLLPARSASFLPLIFLVPASSFVSFLVMFLFFFRGLRCFISLAFDIVSVGSLLVLLVVHAHANI